MGTPDWHGKFDFIVSLCATPCRQRVPSLDAELERIGIRPDLRVWSVPDATERASLNYVSCAPLVRHASYAACTFNHYRAICAAYHLGAERCLLVEDDVRFLRDIDELARIVESVPDADVTMFDLISDGARSPTAGEIRRMLDGSVRDRWAVPQSHPCSMACIGLTRKAMQMFLRCITEPFTEQRGRFDVIDGYLGERYRKPEGIEVRVAWPLAAIQADIPGSVSNTASVFGAGRARSWYGAIGIDITSYGA